MKYFNASICLHHQRKINPMTDPNRNLSASNDCESLLLLIWFEKLSVSAELCIQSDQETN